MASGRWGAERENPHRFHQLWPSARELGVGTATREWTNPGIMDKLELFGAIRVQVASEDIVTAHGSAGSGSYGQEGLVWRLGRCGGQTHPGSGRILSRDHFPGGSWPSSDSRDAKGTMTTPSSFFHPWGCSQQFLLHLHTSGCKPKPQSTCRAVPVTYSNPSHPEQLFLFFKGVVTEVLPPRAPLWSQLEFVHDGSALPPCSSLCTHRNSSVGLWITL